MFLQHSSASRVGRHLPLAQQSAAFGVVNAAKQSYGVSRSKTDTIETAMWIARCIPFSFYQIGLDERDRKGTFPGCPRFQKLNFAAFSIKTRLNRRLPFDRVPLPSSGQPQHPCGTLPQRTPIVRQCPVQQNSSLRVYRADLRPRFHMPLPWRPVFPPRPDRKWQSFM